MTSCTSRRGPIPLPIGWLPSEKMTLTLIPRSFPIAMKRVRRCFALRRSLILTCGPTGMSMRQRFAPTECFFAMMDARSMPSGSSERG